MADVGSGSVFVEIVVWGEHFCRLEKRGNVRSREQIIFLGSLYFKVATGRPKKKSLHEHDKSFFHANPTYLSHPAIPCALIFARIVPSMSTSGLTGSEKRAAKRAAKDIIGTPAPLWSDVGEDKKNDMFQRLLEQLRETENSGIAKKVEENPELAWTILREKSKSMRAEEKKLANKSEYAKHQE
jgi:hypothetical protein